MGTFCSKPMMYIFIYVMLMQKLVFTYHRVYFHCHTDFIMIVTTN